MKITSPLKTPDSIPGKVYEIAFPERKRSYGDIAKEYLSRKEGGDKRDYSRYNGKVADAVKKFPDFFDEEKASDGKRGRKAVKSKVEPIINHVNQEIKKLNELSPLNYETFTEKEEKSLREYLDKTFRKKIKEEEEVYKEKKERAEKSSLSIKTQYPYGILQSFYKLISKSLILRMVRNNAAQRIYRELGWDLPMKGHMEDEKLEQLKNATDMEISNEEIEELQENLAPDLSRGKIKRGGDAVTHPITFYLDENPDYLIRDALDDDFVHGAQFINHWIGKLAWIPEISNIVRSHSRTVSLGFEIYSRGLKGMREEV